MESGDEELAESELAALCKASKSKRKRSLESDSASDDHSLSKPKVIIFLLQCRKNLHY